MKIFGHFTIFGVPLLPTLVFSYPPMIFDRSEILPIPPTLPVPVFPCLQNTSIFYILPSSDSYLALSRSYNLRFNYKPAIIAYPTTDYEVQQLVKCAISLDLNIAVRGGGHSYGAYGLGGEDGRFVIDMERFQRIDYDNSTEIVTVGAGVRLGNLSGKLAAFGRALPHGTCAGVGIAGQSLHGGYGFTSRQWGLTLDVITEVRGITAEGEHFIANDMVNQDLFWALRGAGSSFAIATEFKFITFPAPPVTIAWRYAFQLADSTEAAKAFLRFQDFVREKAPKELAIQVYIDSYSFSVGGNYYGLRGDFDRVIEELFNELTDAYWSRTVRDPQIWIREFNWYDNLVYLNGGAIARPTMGFYEFGVFYAKSLVVPKGDDLRPETVNSLFDFVYGVRGKEPSPYFIVVNLYGGKDSQISKVLPNATAYFDRDAFLVFQFYAYTNGQPVYPFPPEIITFVQNLAESITSKQSPNRTRDWPAYTNYVDTALSFEEAGHRYFGGNLVKLKQLKKQFDPHHRLGGGIGV